MRLWLVAPSSNNSRAPFPSELTVQTRAVGQLVLWRLQSSRGLSTSRMNAIRPPGRRFGVGEAERDGTPEASGDGPGPVDARSASDGTGGTTDGSRTDPEPTTIAPPTMSTAAIPSRVRPRRRLGARTTVGVTTGIAARLSRRSAGAAPAAPPATPPPPRNRRPPPRSVIG